MSGFQQTVHPLLEWIRGGISEIRSTDIEFADNEFRTSHFTQGKGLFNTTRWDQRPASFSAGGDTNLHEAIAAAGEAGLTFIITDGVAAAQVGGAGACSGGADAACVASALEEYVHTSAEPGSDPGVWVLPIVSTFDGKLYTEQRTAAFDPQQTIARVESELDATVRVSNPGTDAQERRTFDYHGPRTLLLIILAQRADVGRAAVRALVNKAPVSGLKEARRLRDIPAGTELAVLQPIELYPGYVPTMQWNDLNKVQNPRLHEGPMDVELAEDNDPPLLRMGCLPDRASRGPYDLRGTMGASSACIDLVVLPAFSFSMRPRSSSSKPALDALLSASPSQESASSTTVRLDLTCDAEALGSCSDPLVAQWTAGVDYGAAARCVASGSCGDAQHQLLPALSTVEPALEPHRIFDFNNLLRLFYEKVSTDERRLILSELALCRK